MNCIQFFFVDKCMPLVYHISSGEDGRRERRTTMNDELQRLVAQCERGILTPDELRDRVTAEEWERVAALVADCWPM
jgi:hypothetical protein